MDSPYATSEPAIHSTTDLFGDRRMLARYSRNSNRRTSERSELFRLFLDELNPGRVKKGLKPLTAERLGYIFEKVPTSDLYALDKACREARSYSALFWYRVKV